MATSNKGKDTKKIEKKDDKGKDGKEESAKEMSESSEKLLDGLIFEADIEEKLRAAEEAEVKEFQMHLKKYYEVSKKLRKDALKQEREELSEGEKSPNVKYYEGTRKERIKSIDMETQLIEEIEKKFGRHA